jgi:multidrug efflux pump subunit AcrA (membrane-fusion protein)
VRTRVSVLIAVAAVGVALTGCSRHQASAAPEPPAVLVTFASQGRFVLVGREVNNTTGTIQFATEFQNKGSLLRPGGFGRVRIKIGTEKDALLIPQQAVNEVQGEYQVVVLSAETIRELVIAFQRPLGRAHRGIRRVFGPQPALAREQRLRADRSGHVDWPVGKECDFDRRVRES